LFSMLTKRGALAWYIEIVIGVSLY
jgi:hypothetical protein